MTKTWQDQYPLNTFTGKTKEELVNFIEGLRKQDEEELIKVLETDSAFIYSDLVIEKLKDYYEE